MIAGRLTRIVTRRAAVATLFAMGLWACSNDELAPVDMAAAVPRPHNFDQISTDIIQPGCANSKSCHTDPGKIPAKVSFCAAQRTDPADSGRELCSASASIDGFYAAIFKTPARNTEARIDGLLLVDPCNPDESFLVRKLELPLSADDSAVGYGRHMPNNQEALPAEMIAGIRDWIARGAHRHEDDLVTGTTCTLGD